MVFVNKKEYIMTNPINQSSLTVTTSDVTVNYNAAQKNYSVCMGRKFYIATADDSRLKGKSEEAICSYIKEILSQKEVFESIHMATSHSYKIYAPTEQNKKIVIDGFDQKNVKNFSKSFIFSPEILAKIKNVFDRCLSIPSKIPTANTSITANAVGNDLKKKIKNETIDYKSGECFYILKN